MGNTQNKDFSEKVNLLKNKKYSGKDKIKILFSCAIGMLICLANSFIVNASLAEISFNPIFSLVYFLKFIFFKKNFIQFLLIF